MDFPQPALGMVETSSIARGVVVTDVVVKKAVVKLLRSHPISRGKYIVLFNGGEAEVEESLQEGRECAGDTLVDTLFIPNAHPQLARGVADAFIEVPIDSIGLIETSTVAANILAADAALKAAAVQLIKMRLGQGIGGKAVFTLSGDLYNIEAAIEAGVGRIDERFLVRHEIIPAPHADVTFDLLSWHY